MLQRNNSTAPASKNQHDETRGRDSVLLAKCELFDHVVCANQLTAAEQVIFWRLLYRHHNCKTGRCDPSEETLAKATGFTLRTVERAIEGLERRKLITVERRNRKTTNSYGFPGLADPTRTSGLTRQGCRVHTDRDVGSGPDTHVGLTLESEPEKEPEKGTTDSRASGAACDDAPFDMFGKRDEQDARSGVLITHEVSQQASEAFELFWAIYPRRAKRLAARRAWDKAVKTVTAEEIIEGARRYAREREDQPMKYTNHPATWLNGGGWMDDPGANVSHEQGYAEINAELCARNDEENGLPLGTTARQREAEHARASTKWLDDIEVTLDARGQR